MFDDPNLPLDSVARQPPRLPLAHHLHRFIATDRPPGRAEGSKPLLGVHPLFDRTMVLFHDVVQILHWPVAAAPADDAGPLECRYG